MASNINPTNIDGTYPVAGQDNDSQGFRDNFTNSKNNFSYAKAEIEDLQNKAVLKEPLIGEVVGANFNNLIRTYPLKGAVLSDLVELIVDHGTTSGTITVNFQAAHYQTVTLNNPLTVNWSNFENGKNCRLILEAIVNNVAHTIALDNTKTYNASSNLQDYDAGTKTFTFARTGTYWFEFNSRDGGSSFLITPISRNKMYAHKANNAVASNLTAYTIDLTETGTERTVFSANANVTISYSATGYAGKESKVFIRNLAGGNITVFLPDTKNNKAANSFTQATLVTSTLVFNALDNSNGNVFCTVINS